MLGQVGTYLVEHYLPGATPEGFRATATRLRSAAATLRDAGTPIRYRRAILMPADEAAFCVFEAESVDVVEQLYCSAGITFDRIVDALEV
jgi:hypothetical protein